MQQQVCNDILEFIGFVVFVEKLTVFEICFEPESFVAARGSAARWMEEVESGVVYQPFQVLRGIV